MNYLKVDDESEVDSIDLVFPILCYKEKEARLMGVPKKEFGYATKGQGKFLNGLQVIDANGLCYKVTSWKIIGKSGFLKSILHLQVLEKLEIKLAVTGKMNLSELKDFIVDRIVKHPKTFAPLYDGTPWKQRINEFNSISDLIKLFR